MFPIWTGKPGKTAEHFAVRVKSGNFAKSGKVGEKPGSVTQRYGKIRKKFYQKIF